MTFKDAAITHKPWSQTEILGFSPTGFIAKLMNTISAKIPIGYQDESGFHTGVKSVDREAGWPRFW
jgi:hypothetical protein